METLRYSDKDLKILLKASEERWAKRCRIAKILELDEFGNYIVRNVLDVKSTEEGLVVFI